MQTNMQNLYEGLKASFIRFPLSILMALVASAITIFDVVGFGENKTLVNVVLLCVLGFITFMALEFLLQTIEWRGRKRWAANAALVLAFVVYHIISPDIMSSLISWYRYCFLIISSLMLLSLSPFLTRNKSERFWAFTMGILMGIARTAFFGFLMFVGISVAWMSIQELFGVDLETMVLRTWIAVVGIFGPFYFFTQVRPGFENKDGMENTIRGAGLYILLPLTVVYFLIIYSYMVFILAKNDLPQNVLGTLIVAYVLFGLFLYAGLYPLRRAFARGPLIEKVFLGAIIPQIAMLFWAVYLRVSAYGITEQRYLLIAIGVWFTVVTCYLLFSKNKDLRVFPVTIIIGCAIASVGPVSAFEVSRVSQMNKLKQIATDIGAWHDEKIDKSLVKDSTRLADFTSVMAYLWRVHGVTSVQSLFDEDLPREFTYIGSYEVEQFLGIQGAAPSASWKRFSYTASRADTVVRDIAGYQVSIPFDATCYDNDCRFDLARFDRDGSSYYAFINRQNNELVLNANKSYEEAFALDRLFASLQGEYSDQFNLVAPADLEFTGGGNGLRFKVMFDAISGAVDANNKENIEHVAGTLLLQF